MLGNSNSLEKSKEYTLPIASSSTLGGVKVGSGLNIDGNGVLSSFPISIVEKSFTKHGDSDKYTTVYATNINSNSKGILLCLSDYEDVNNMPICSIFIPYSALKVSIQSSAYYDYYVPLDSGLDVACHLHFYKITNNTFKFGTGLESATSTTS